MISRQHFTYSFAVMLVGTLFAAPVAVFSGLAIAPFYIIILTVLLIESIKKNAIAVPFNSTILIAVLFALWGLIACLWAINTDKALTEWASTFVVILLSIIVAGSLQHLRKIQLEGLALMLAIAVPLALLLLLIELYSYGTLYAFFRINLFHKTYPYYNPEVYNRGACFLAVIFWAMVMAFSRGIRQQPGGGLTLWFGALGAITFLLLGTLESLSARIAFAGSVIAFVAVLAMPRTAIRIIQIIAILLAFTWPILTPQLQPTEYVNKGIPTSALHRIFIWHFAGTKAKERPWMGYGFYGSREVPGGKEQIKIPNQSLPDGSIYLPNHTHNSMIQIWLELGYVGLALYTLAIVSAFSWILAGVRAPLQQALISAMLVSYLGISLLSYNVWQEWWVATGLFAFLLMRIYVDGFIEYAPNMRGGRTKR